MFSVYWSSRPCLFCGPKSIQQGTEICILFILVLMRTCMLMLACDLFLIKPLILIPLLKQVLKIPKHIFVLHFIPVLKPEHALHK
jgi:hypothetical protein